MKSRILVPLIIVLTVAFALDEWRQQYPSPSDPKNIWYVLWKFGLYNMDLHQATETMIGDPSRDKLVIGKTEVELQRKFGSLVKPSQASDYMRGCYLGSSWKDQKVLFLKDSPWMVVFRGDRAIDLVLIKGC